MSEKILTQHRESKPFEEIKKGIKKIEIRLCDKKRRGIKLGQKIKLINRINKNETLIVRVIGLSKFENFEKLFKVFNKEIKGYEKEILKRVYSKEKEKKFGVLVIHFELIK